MLVLKATKVTQEILDRSDLRDQRVTQEILDRLDPGGLRDLKGHRAFVAKLGLKDPRVMLVPSG